MLYKFKSKNSGDLIMTGPVGDAVLRVMGKEPAPKGILETADMPTALRALEEAVAAEEAARAQAEAESRAAGERLPPASGLGLRQRAWPMVEMIKRAQKAGVDIVWGV